MLKDTPLLEAYLDLHPKRKAIAPEDKFSRKLLDFLRMVFLNGRWLYDCIRKRAFFKTRETISLPLSSVIDEEQDRSAHFVAPLCKTSTQR